MPAKGSWKTCPKPTSALQKGQFMDRCTDWIVSEPVVDEPAVSFKREARTNWEGGPRYVWGSIGFTQMDLKLRIHKSCIFCSDTRDVVAVNANPFAHSGTVIVCRRCVP